MREEAFFKRFPKVGCEERNEVYFTCPHCGEESDWGTDEINTLKEISEEVEAPEGADEFGDFVFYKCEKCEKIFRTL